MSETTIPLSIHAESQSEFMLRTDWSDLVAYCQRECGQRALLCVTHPQLRTAFGDHLAAQLEVAGLTVHWCELPEGESSKHIASVHTIYEHLAALGADRATPLCSIGGGVIGDVSGFAAATYLRGIPWINVPTTVVGQLDSGLGGKTGVNFAQGKNIIGSFYQPQLVYANLGVLESLQPLQRADGMVEALKCGIIQDLSIVEHLEVHGKEADLAFLIAASVRVKSAIVATDPFERSGQRMQLNLGHTVGHALEVHGDYGEWSHGQAVAMGLVAAARLSARWGYCTPAIEARIVAVLHQLGMPTVLPQLPAARWAELLRGEKKRAGRQISFVAIQDLGALCIHRVGIDDLAVQLAQIASDS